MHCKDWEELVALHVGDDLTADRASAVERHLAGCSGCQVLWSGMRESLELLQAAHAEPLPAAAYTAVRGRVLAKLRAGRRTWWLWAAGLAAVAAMVLVALAVWPERRVEPLPRVALAVPAAVPEYARKRAWQAKPPASPPRATTKPKPSAREPLLVRLVSDDPNIVIYWIAD